MSHRGGKRDPPWQRDTRTCRGTRACPSVTAPLRLCGKQELPTGRAALRGASLYLGRTYQAVAPTAAHHAARRTSPLRQRHSKDEGAARQNLLRWPPVFHSASCKGTKGGWIVPSSHLQLKGHQGVKSAPTTLISLLLDIRGHKPCGHRALSHPPWLGARQELSSTLPFAPLQKLLFRKTGQVSPPHSKPYRDHGKILLRSGGTATRLLFHCQKLVKTRLSSAFLGDSQASNPRQGHGVTITSLPLPSGPFSPGLGDREANPHGLSRTVKQTRN